jgi:predicted metal-dependent hydrolase
MFFTKKRVNYKSWFELGTAHVPIQVKFEVRHNARASIGSSGLIVRMPKGINESEEQKLVRGYIDWARNWLMSKPETLTTFVRKDYSEERKLTVGKYEYDVFLEEIAGVTAHQASIKNQRIHIRLKQDGTELAKNKAVKTLLSRIVAKHQKPWIAQRVLELNHLHFQRPIKNIYLKYNKSNWGSCSVGSNINFSTRLLFAPTEVIDYVIIHELAHLIEHNHSDRFWAQVERAMPDYVQHEKWLKEHGKFCDF